MAGPEYQEEEEEEAHSVDKNNITPRPVMQWSESSGAPERARVCAASYLRSPEKEMMECAPATGG